MAYCARIHTPTTHMRFLTCFFTISYTLIYPLSRYRYGLVRFSSFCHLQHPLPQKPSPVIRSISKYTLDGLRPRIKLFIGHLFKKDGDYLIRKNMFQSNSCAIPEMKTITNGPTRTKIISFALLHHQMLILYHPYHTRRYDSPSVY